MHCWLYLPCDCVLVQEKTHIVFLYTLPLTKGKSNPHFPMILSCLFYPKSQQRLRTIQRPFLKERGEIFLADRNLKELVYFGINKSSPLKPNTLHKLWSVSLWLNLITPSCRCFFCFVQIADDLGMNAWTEKCPYNDRSLTYKVTKSSVYFVRW